MQIQTIKPCHVAYLRHIGPYGAENAQTMESLKSWAKSRGLLNEKSVILGIALDNPEITNPQSCRYDACVAISDNCAAYNDTQSGIAQGIIPGGKYAVFTISHTTQAIQKAWLEVFPELEGKGCKIDEARPIIERYAVEMVNKHLCEICVPIK